MKYVLDRGNESIKMGSSKLVLTLACRVVSYHVHIDLMLLDTPRNTIRPVHPQTQRLCLAGDFISSL